jgi:exopolysaccharide biosynthesis polyprenyl glycosylphosphotransferase
MTALEQHDRSGEFSRRRVHAISPPLTGRRGWLMRRLLVVADVAGLCVAFVTVELLFGNRGTNPVSLTREIALFVVSLPVFVLGAKLFGLYDRDEARAAHSTPDDLVRVFLLMTVAVFIVEHAVDLSAAASPDLVKLSVFWAVAIVGVTAARIAARTLARSTSSYVQNSIIVGAGEIGQLIARKLLRHQEYGVKLVAFVDAHPKEQHPEVEHVEILGGIDTLEETVDRLDVERVIFADSDDRQTDLPELIRRLRDRGVQVDVVPRLFEVIGPNVDVHAVEGIPLIGLPPVRLPRSSRAIKRALDVMVASACLFLTAPALALIAFLIKRDSRGPIFFRQTRLGKDMRPFTLLKFRTMNTETDDCVHREFIAATMERGAVAATTGLYKLERGDAITPIGRVLRGTSLDELPQLFNVLRGQMSLVGPRPCIPYETERFRPHHFDRFLVPAGLTGLWQTSARAQSTFGEALDMDVLYAQSWSLSLDLLLLARTPLQLLRSGATA